MILNSFRFRLADAMVVVGMFPKASHSCSFQSGPRLAHHLVIALLLLSTVAAFGCEPVYPLIMLIGGPAYSSLLGVVLIKCVAFAMLERRLPKKRTALGMFYGNIISSFVGILLALAFSSAGALFVFIPIVFLLSIKPCRRVVRIVPWPWVQKRQPAVLAALLIPLLLILTMVLFSIAIGILDSERYALYWPMKLVYILVGLSLSLFLTSIWEEWAVAKKLVGLDSRVHFFPSVLRANYLTFGLFFLIAAAIQLPRRLDSPNFLIILGLN